MVLRTYIVTTSYTSKDFILVLFECFIAVLENDMEAHIVLLL